MISILFYIPRFGVKGPMRGHLSLLYRTMNQKSRSILLIPLEWGKSRGISPWMKSMGLLFYDLYRLIDQIFREKAAAVQLNSSFDLKAVCRDWIYAVTIKTLRRRLILKYHGTIESLMFTQNFILRGFVQGSLKRADVLFVLNQIDRARFIEEWSCDPQKVIVVKNPLDMACYHRDMKMTRDEGALLYVSRIMKKKGIYDVIEALCYLEENSAKLYVAGEAVESVDDIQNEIHKRGLQNRVIFLGWLDKKDLLTYLYRSTIMVFPSYYPEGLPMAVLEAMACGLPVITTPTHFATEYLRDQQNCLVTPVGDATALAKCIINLLGDPDLRNRLSIQGQKCVHAFDIHQVWAEYESIYLNLLKGSKEV